MSNVARKFSHTGPSQGALPLADRGRRIWNLSCQQHYETSCMNIGDSWSIHSCDRSQWYILDDWVYHLTLLDKIWIPLWRLLGRYATHWFDPAIAEWRISRLRWRHLYFEPQDGEVAQSGRAEPLMVLQVYEEFGQQDQVHSDGPGRHEVTHRRVPRVLKGLPQFACLSFVRERRPMATGSEPGMKLLHADIYKCQGCRVGGIDVNGLDFSETGRNPCFLFELIKFWSCYLLPNLCAKSYPAKAPSTLCCIVLTVPDKSGLHAFDRVGFSLEFSTRCAWSHHPNGIKDLGGRSRTANLMPDQKKTLNLESLSEELVILKTWMHMNTFIPRAAKPQRNFSPFDFFSLWRFRGQAWPTSRFLCGSWTLAEQRSFESVHNLKCFSWVSYIHNLVITS